MRVKGRVYDIIEAFINYKNEHYEIIKKQYETQFTEYKKENEKEKEKHMNEKLGNLPIHQLKKRLHSTYSLMDFDATSLYPSAMYDEKYTYPKTEMGYANTKDTNDELVEKIINQTFTKGRAILKIKNNNPKNSIVQHLPVKVEVNKIEALCMRNAYIIYTLRSVVFQGVVIIGGKVIEVLKVLYIEIF